MTHLSIWLRNIFSNGKTGCLVLSSATVSKKFFFQKGRLIQVTTNRIEERLGRILLKLGKITQEEYDDLDKAILPKRALGEVLMDRGVITKKDLDEALECQMREAVLNAFSCFNADLIFHPHENSNWEENAPVLEVPPLIESGIRGMPHHESLRHFLAGKTFGVKNRRFLDLLQPAESGLLDRFNGRDAAESIRFGSGLDPDSFWKSLLIFYCLDMVEAQQPATAPPPVAEFEPDVPPDPVSGDDQRRMAEILAFREKISNMDYYRILGVSRKTPAADIKKAYFVLARKYHPDRLGPEITSEFRGPIDEVFEMITTAYKTLADREMRSAYDNKIDGSTPGDEDAPDSQKRAEIKFRQGKTLYNQTRYEEVVILLEEAVRLKKDKGDYFLLLALAQTRIPGQVRKAEGNFLKAIELEPWNPEGFVGLGYLYKNEDMSIRALRQFQKAVELDPDHKAARHEADVLGGIRRKKGLKGLFSHDLFGKKKKSG